MTCIECRFSDRVEIMYICKNPCESVDGAYTETLPLYPACINFEKKEDDNK